MARYNGSNYELSIALKNIGKGFWQKYKDDLFLYASNRKRTDVLDKIHEEWTVGKNNSPEGTQWRIEWAIAIYEHGDWEKSTLPVASTHSEKPEKEKYCDPRKKYDAVYRCDNGIYVRSLSELCIANWLYANNYSFEYERSVSFMGVRKAVHCDFYLPKEDVYIEFWGKPEDKEYASYMDSKISEYSKNGYKLVSLYLEDLHNLRDCLMEKLKSVESR